jgi:HEAT repeat protein
VGRASRRSFRLAALELFPVLAGESRERLTRIVDGLGLVDDAMRTLARSPRAFARRTAADELGEIRSARAAPAFVAGLDDRDAIVRVACVRGLASIDELGHVERMLDVLEGDSATAPSEAAAAMGTIARAKPEALAQLQRSGSRFVAWLAALALARTGNAIAMPALLVDLTAVNTLLGSVAVRAIEEVGGLEAIASLEQFVIDADQDAALRAQAGRALERLHAAGGAL